MMSPCKGCPDRSVSPNCHMSCERYIAYQQYREQIRAARAVDHAATSALLSGVRRVKNSLNSQKKPKK